jgi:hypothetical protein
MSSYPPPQNNPASDDEWESAQNTDGQWESDADATRSKPQARPRVARRAVSAPPAAASASPLGAMLGDPAARPFLLVMLLAVLGICALGCLILTLLGLNALGDGERPLGGLFGAREPEATALPPRPLTETVKIAVNGTAVPPGIPTRMTVGNRSFDIAPLQLNQDRGWTYNPNDRRAAYWAAGTLVNYVVGLHSSTDNRALYDAAVPGDLITLETGAGVQRYRIAEKSKIKADDLSFAVSQNAPRLTLIMLGQSGDERDVLVAQYTDEGTANQQTAIGSPINLGDVRVTALSAALVPGNTAGLSEGRNYYQVNLRVTNVLTRILDARQFYAELVDGQGNRYQLSQAGTNAAGGLGWAQGALEPGRSLTLTSAFEVPSSMAGPYLEWKFAVDRENPYVARVAVSYQPIFVEPTAAATSAPRARVDIVNANISPDGTELNVIGTITNLTDQTVNLSLTDAELKGADGQVVPLNGSVPPLPWQVTPGQTLTFRVTFAKPASLPATFTLFGERVEIAAQ